MPFGRLKVPLRLVMAGLRVFKPTYAAAVDKHTNNVTQGIKDVTVAAQTQRALSEDELIELQDAWGELLRVAQEPPK